MAGLNSHCSWMKAWIWSVLCCQQTCVLTLTVCVWPVWFNPVFHSVKQQKGLEKTRWPCCFCHSLNTSPSCPECVLVFVHSSCLLRWSPFHCDGDSTGQRKADVFGGLAGPGLLTLYHSISRYTTHCWFFNVVTCPPSISLSTWMFNIMFASLLQKGNAKTFMIQILMKCVFVNIGLVFFFLTPHTETIGWNSDHTKAPFFFCFLASTLFCLERMFYAPVSSVWWGGWRPAAVSCQNLHYTARVIIHKSAGSNPSAGREAAGPAPHMFSCCSLAQVLNFFFFFFWLKHMQNINTQSFMEVKWVR